jgi:diguanylate cyclase (GGDEF)-like protein
MAEGRDRVSFLQEQLQRGYPWMHFDPLLESAYRDDQFNDSLKHLRINLTILVLLVVAIVQVDHIVIPSFTSAVPNLVRLGVMVPILLIALGLTYLPKATIWYPRVMSVLMAIALMGISWIGLFAWSEGEDRIFVRLIIGTIAVYFMMGLRFRLALAANLMTFVFYIGAAAYWAVPTMALTHFLAMLLVTSVICAGGAYNLEHARRTAWLEGRLLAEFAMRDGLTGIHNRRRLDDHLQQVWQHGLREQKSLALLFSDIDAFKAFNDRYGHQAGDEALRAVASVHARHGRRPLDMAARFGGEEFAIVLFGVGRADAQVIAERIMRDVRALAIPHAQSDSAPVLTTSIGIACVIPGASQSSGELLQLADRALYQAKNDGGNRAHIIDVDADRATYRT